MTTLERMNVLRAEIANLRTELDALETADRDAENATRVGTCYRYRNSGGHEGAKWWLYLKVLCVEDGSMRAHKFEIRPDGYIHIEPNAYVWRELNSGYEQIAERDFHRAWTECQELVASLPKPVVQ